MKESQWDAVREVRLREELAKVPPMQLYGRWQTDALNLKPDYLSIQLWKRFHWLKSLLTESTSQI
jgi:hypothetical protein